jgi:predicted GIY-YIG superfamily endonuclease
MIYIYGLYNSKESVTNIRYIGQTKNPTQRLSAHRTTKDGTQKAQWVSAVRGAVNMVILDTAEDVEQACIKENAWILFGKSRGWELVNGTNPGEHRSTIVPEFVNIQDLSSLVQQMAADKDAIQKRWYRFSLSTAILVACAAIAYLLASGIKIGYDLPVADRMTGYSLLLSAYFMPFAYGLVVWVILKDMPLYRLPIFNLHRKGLSAFGEWRQQMTAGESKEFDCTMSMVKRMALRIGGVAFVLAVLALFS